MRVFHYKSGIVAGVTMTVGELIAHLQQYPAELPVLAEWQGCLSYVNPAGFEIRMVEKCYEHIPSLVIDVEKY